MVIVGVGDEVEVDVDWDRLDVDKGDVDVVSGWLDVDGIGLVGLDEDCGIEIDGIEVEFTLKSSGKKIREGVESLSPDATEVFSLQNGNSWS